MVGSPTLSPSTSSPAVASTPTPSPDLSPLWSSVQRTHAWEPRPVEGTLPEGLRATLVRTGPGLMERFGRRLAHSFEADGVMTGLRLPGDGQAHAAVRVVESPGYRQEEAVGKPLFGSAAPWWRRFLNGLRMRGKETGNTSILEWQGRTYALMEGARPIEIDVGSLGTLAVESFGGVLGPTFSAHPHRLPSAKTTFNFGVEYGPKPALALYALPDEGPARRLGRVPLPWNAMVHDFAITERAMVFVVCPLQISLGRALLAPRDMATLFRWVPEAGTLLLVVPLDDIEHPIRIPIDARFVFHLANAHHQADALCIDMVQYPNADVLTALSGTESPRLDPPRLQRVVVDPATATVRDEQVLWDRACDFPVLPEDRVGQPYSTLWLFAGEERGDAGGIARLDLDTGKADVWNPGPGYSPSEALFLPDPHATRPNQGWLLSLVLDGWRGESFFGVFDAEHPSAGPLARIWMGQPLPATFHGSFVRSAAEPRAAG